MAAADMRSRRAPFISTVYVNRECATENALDTYP